MFLGTLQQQLSALLPPGFVSRPEQRVYIVPDGREARPDASLPAPATASHRPSPSAGRVATAPRQTPPERAPRPAGQVVEKFIEIRDVRSSSKNVVAIIELLNPAKKETGSIDRSEYLRKQTAALTGKAHLIEIDLLRGGEHTVYVPENVLRARGPFDYVVTLADAAQPTEYIFWRVSLREPLPVIDVPLAEGITGIKLDLQTHRSARAASLFRGCALGGEAGHRG
ncbi:hypothetical protein FGG08_007529 [Glutinoglossum americanum]|uniref:Uncharacterized protein n=1 Tax=Glutinoglossum americanum TaxID=1670608 RepID=A0A9P8HTZ4_9PEZI|nr:hypothetical protein FGG08_007529 [Glutinoglossum americanum]